MRQGSTKYTDDEIIAALQQCAEDLGRTTFGVKCYSNWRKKQKGATPSDPLILRRTVEATGGRGWNAWKAAAGQEVNERRVRGFGDASFAEEDLFLALARLEGTLGSFPSIIEYDAMKRECDPTAGAIRFRLGRWSQALTLYREWKKKNSQTTWHIEIPN